MPRMTHDFDDLGPGPFHEDTSETWRDRLQRQGEDTLGKIVRDVAQNPWLGEALSAALRTGEKAAKAQEVALGALHLPTAADMDRLTRRIRSISHRLEEIEEGIDRVEDQVRATGETDETEGFEPRLASIEKQLDRLETKLTKPVASQSPANGSAKPLAKPVKAPRSPKAAKPVPAKKTAKASRKPAGSSPRATSRKVEAARKANS